MLQEKLSRQGHSLLLSLFFFIALLSIIEFLASLYQTTSPTNTLSMYTTPAA